nr:germination lipoprotein GerS [Romboutsia sp. 1001713B170207_170306_H8]
MTLILLTGCVLISCIGCQDKEYTKEEIYEKFQEQVLKIESYTCTAELKVVGNKGESSYTIKESYNKPDNYRLEIISPKNLKGQTIEYNDKKITIKNVDVNDSIDFPNKSKNMQYLFIGDFIKSYLQSENNEELAINMSNEYLELESKIKGDDKYFNKQKLYINLKDKNPDKMEIIDKEGNIRFTVEYKNFEYKK